MPKLRNAQFYRNMLLTAYNSYDLAVQNIKTAFETQKSNLKDGEFILGRYSYPKGDGVQQMVANGIIVGVAREVGQEICLDFLADETYVAQAIAALSTQQTLVSVAESHLGGVTYDLTSELVQDNGLIISSGVTTLTFGTYPTANNPIVTYTDMQGIVSASIQGGGGIVVNSQASGSTTVNTVNVNLGPHSTVGTTTEYNNDTDNLLILATDGKLSISDTWDCGTY